MTANDLELLRRFTRDQSQDAFTELVQRHVNLVYSAALRQVRLPQLAEEVAQSVFADLARDADKLGSGIGVSPVESLTPWLYAVTRRTAIDVIRQESRRQLREHLAYEMNITNAPDANWNHIEPLLDEAVSALDDTDRAAVLLRFFEHKSLREVGQQLGVSDDTAQKRVSRAVEKLREFFAKRGVTVGAGGLVVVISANAVQAAPVGLALTLSAAALAGTAVSTATIITATKTIAMTTLQKTVITAAFVAAAGAGIFEARQAAQLREQNRTLQQSQAPLAEQNQQLLSERDNATNRLAAMSDEIAKIKSNNLELLKLRGEVTLLRNELTKQIVENGAPSKDVAGNEQEPYKRYAKLLVRYFEQNPNAQIPEMKLLPREEMHSASIYALAVKLAAQNDPANYGKQGFFDENQIKLETNEEYRRAASELRSYAEYSVAPKLCAALKEYLQANNGTYPKSVSDLQPFFSTPLDETILQRFEVQPASNFPQIQSKYDSSVRLSGFVITPKTAIDEDFDHRIIIGSANYMVGDSGSFKP